MPLIAMNNVPATSDPGRNGSVYGPYVLCGWKVVSAMPLPELNAWPSQQDESAAVALRLLLEEDAIPGSDEFHYTLQTDGAFLLHLPGLATFRVSPDAATVTISPHPDAEAQLLRAHFYGSIVAVLCFMRGLLPLHGACVHLGEAAVIFTGASGAGKSTMAAAFAQRGHAVLCDDVCAIDVSRDQARVWPAFPRLKLLPDAIAAFSLDQDTLYTHAARGEKGHFLLQQHGLAVLQSAVPIAAIYLLSSEEPDHIEIHALRGTAAFLPLRTQVHRSNMGAALGQRDRMFRDLSRLLAQTPVFQLSRPKDLACIDDVVQAIVQRHRQPV